MNKLERFNLNGDRKYYFKLSCYLSFNFAVNHNSANKHNDKTLGRSFYITEIA